MQSGMVAIVLAGGKGKRMDILCQMRPKPALPFAGRLRVIDFSLSNCVHSQISDIAVLVDYQRSHMEDYLRRWHAANDLTEAFQVLEPRAGSYGGTADAVHENLAYLEGRAADRVLILAGDHVYRMDYRRMLAFHEQVKADVTVGVAAVPIDQAHRFGIVTTDSDGRISGFVEKPGLPKSNLVSMGIYIFNTGLLSRRLSEDAQRPDSSHDFGYAIIPEMVKRDKVYACRFDGYWRDIGTAQAYYSANMELVKPELSVGLDGTWPILTERGDLSPAKVVGQGSVENSIIGPGCVVRGRVENSILSPGVWVGEQAVVVSGDWDVTVLGKGTTVPAGYRIGRNCKVAPHVGGSDFPTNVVPSGAAVSPLRGGPAREVLANER